MPNGTISLPTEYVTKAKVATMRVLCFDAKITVHLDNASPMTPNELAGEVLTEICIGADIPQASHVADYAIKDVTIRFAGEGPLIPDEEQD